MANRIHDLYFSENGLVYDWRPDTLRVTLQFTSLQERRAKVNPNDYKCRVYCLGDKRSLYHQYTICCGTYEECLEIYKKNFKKYYMMLQLYINKGYGVDTYLDNKDGYYFWLKEVESRAREKADSSHYWRAGDARWDAPGMSIHDFI